MAQSTTDKGDVRVTDDQRETKATQASVPVRREWETMALTRVGGFGDVLQGVTGPSADIGAGMTVIPG
jgi:hypothetical protein